MRHAIMIPDTPQPKGGRAEPGRHLFSDPTTERGKSAKASMRRSRQEVSGLS